MKTKKLLLMLLAGFISIYLSGCASLGYSPLNKTEKVKVTFK